MTPLLRQGSKPEVLTSAGAPYHGVAVEGELDLSGSGGPTITGLSLGSRTWCVSLSNPNRTLPTRSGAQVTADAAVGRAYRDYALAPDRRVHGGYGVSQQQSVYFDSRGYVWLVDWSELLIDWGADELSGDVTAARFLHVGDVASPATLTDSPSLTPAGQSGSVHSGSAAMRVMDQLRDGSAVILSNRLDLAPEGIWLAELSDTVDEGAGTYPYGGGTTALTVSLSVLKGRADMFGTVAWSDDLNYTVTLSDGTDVPLGDVGTTCSNMGGSGSNYCYKESPAGPDVLSGSFEDVILYASYDAAGAVVYWSADVSVTREVTYAMTLTGGGGEQTLEATDVVTWDLALKLDGTGVDSRQVTVTRDYIGTFDETSTVSTIDSAVTAASAGLTDVTGGYTDTRNNANDASSVNISQNATAWAGGGSFPAAPGPLEGARRVTVLGEEPEEQLPLFSGSLNGDTWKRTSGFLPELDEDLNDELQALQIRIANYGGNKTLGMHSYVGTFQLNATDVSFVSYDGVVLGDVYSPDGSQTPDTTERVPASSDWGTPVAYDPENVAWSVSAWDAGLERWERRHFV